MVDLRDELVELVANELLGEASRQLSRYDEPHLSLRAGLLPLELAGRGLAVSLGCDCNLAALIRACEQPGLSFVTRSD